MRATTMVGGPRYGKAVGLVLLAALCVAMIPTAADAQDVVAFGAAPGGRDDERLSGLAELEGQLGRSLDFVRVFELWDSPFPTAYHDTLDSRGQRMLLSVRARRLNGTFIPWRDIADATPGSAIHNQLVAWIQRIEALDTPVWLTFNHEPEVVENVANGTSEDFVDAWRRIVSEFDAQGVTDVEFVWIMTDYSFHVPSTDRRYADDWYPGDDYVDHIGADPYNYSSCRPSEPIAWRSLESFIEPIRQFGANHPDKGLVLAEWASTEEAGDGGAAKAAWIADVRALLKSPGWEQFIAVSYFDRVDPNYPNCAWPADSSPAALGALRAMAEDAYYGGGTGVNLPPVVAITAPADQATVSGVVTVTATADDPDGVAQVEFTADTTPLGVDTDGSNGWTATFDTTTFPDSQVAIQATATDTLDAADTATITVTIDNTNDPTVAMIVASPTNQTSGETTVVNRLQSTGHQVTVIDDNTVTPATAEDYDLVIINSSVTTVIADTLKNTTTPLLISKPWLLDDHGMTGPTGGTHYGSTSTSQINITNPGHPLAAGLNGTITITPSARLTQFGIPAGDATTIATLPTTTTPTIFIYEPGTQLADGTTATGCRIAFSIYQNQPDLFTTNAWTLFDTTTTYATNGCSG